MKPKLFWSLFLLLSSTGGITALAILNTKFFLSILTFIGIVVAYFGCAFIVICIGIYIKCTIEEDSWRPWKAEKYKQDVPDTLGW